MCCHAEDTSVRELADRGENHAQLARLPLVALAGILPDADGLGLVVDWITNARGGVQTGSIPNTTTFCSMARLAAVLIAAVMAAFAQDRCRVAWLALVTFHLHLVCDLVGSRGPSPQDLWPHLLFGPSLISDAVMAGQWRLDGGKIAISQRRSFFGRFGSELNAAILCGSFQSSA